MNGWRNLFPNAWLIAQKEYRGALRGKAFIIGTIILAVVAFLATQAPTIIEKVAGDSQIKVGVVATTSTPPAEFMTILDNSLNGAPQPGSNAKKSFVLNQLPDEASADSAMKKGEVAAVLIIGRDPKTLDLTFVLRADTPSDGREATLARIAVQQLAIDDRLVRANVPPQAVFQDVSFTLQSPNGTTEKTATTASTINDEVSKSLINTGLVVLIFMAIVTYGTWVAMSVAEEKGSRVMELMLNAVTPLQMLAGKVIGTGAAGLTQYGIIVLAMLIGITAQGPIRKEVLGTSGDGASFGGLTPEVLGAFIVLFVLGFLLYALLYAALGSLVSRQEDVQSATGPLMMLVMIGYFASLFAAQSTQEAWVKILSFVPFFTPYMMLTRMSQGPVELWEMGLAVAIMLASSAVALFVAARIYSAGVLLYGQRVSLRKVLTAVRVAR